MSRETVKTRKINLAKVCRSCLSEKGHLREIHTTRIPKMMENCASVKVFENDGLPSNVCVTCFRLISKFHAFKKKMERSDRILRQHIRYHRIKLNNIAKLALNVTELHQNMRGFVQSNKEFREQLSVHKPELSEEDIPLSKRVLKLSQCVKKGVTFKNYELEELDLRGSNIEDFQTGDTVQIFTDGPPPLVPLAPVKKQGHIETIVKNLPEDTPPLIPIKPLVNIDILENIVEKNEDITYKCTTCNKEFASVAYLKEHKFNICQPNALNALQCNICKKDFKDSKKLIGHLKGHMIAKDYACKICGKCYPNPSTFTVHMRSHTGERPFKCHVCSKGFVRWAGVVGHMKTHEESKPYKCETCGKCFKVSSNLERHKILHSGSLPYCCNYCGKCFSQSDNLQLHIRTYHTHERPYLCSECGKGFVSSTRLNRHMWVHSGYKPYICASCPKAYSNSNDLKNHERSHLGKKSDDYKKWACDVCDMKFYHPCRLARHMKIHERPFICHICKKSFTSNSVLSKHIENKHGLTYMEESMLQPDEGVSQIFVQYHPRGLEKSEHLLDYEKMESLSFQKSESLQFM